MRFFKLGLISIILLFALMVIFAMLLPSTIHISRTIDLNAPYDTVYSYFNDVTKWKEWYPRYDQAKASYAAKTTGAGAKIILDKTVVTIQESSKQKIVTWWQTGTSAPMRGEFQFRAYDKSGTASVQWLFVQKVKWYPWEKFAAILSDKAIGPFMEQSLDNLKKRVEKE